MPADPSASAHVRRREPSPDAVARDTRRVIGIVDAHYGGDVSRVVFSGIPVIPGASVREKRDWLQTSGDDLRRLLLYPPYGNPSMCANMIVDPDPDMPEAQAGYIIMEAMGYPHFSGSNSICVVTALLETGYLPMDAAPDGTVVQEVLLEAPAGLVRATAIHDGTHVQSVTVDCDAAYVVRRDVVVDIDGHGPVRFDLVWSGCYYAVVDAPDLGFALTAAERPALAAFANDLCLAATPHLDLTHPRLGDTGPLSFVAFAGPLTREGDAWYAPSATYVHPGVVCACPTGTGTAARMALGLSRNEFTEGDALVTASPTGSTMTGRILGTLDTDGVEAVRVSVTGQAFTLGRTELVVNRDDDLVNVDGIWPLLDTPTL